MIISSKGLFILIFDLSILVNLFGAEQGKVCNLFLCLLYILEQDKMVE